MRRGFAFGAFVFYDNHLRGVLPVGNGDDQIDAPAQSERFGAQEYVEEAFALFSP